MKLGIFDEVNRILSDGADVKPSMESWQTQQADAAIRWLEKFIQAIKRWIMDTSRSVKRNLAAVRMKLGKMFGIEPMRMIAPAVVVNLCVDDGRIMHYKFKDNFRDILDRFNNVINYARNGWYAEADAAFIQGKMENIETNSEATLKQLTDKLSEYSDGLSGEIEVGGSDIKQFDKILQELQQTDFGAQVSQVDYADSFKRSFQKIAQEIGKDEADALAQKIASIQAKVITVLDTASKAMYKLLNQFVQVGAKLSGATASMEDFDVSEVPLVVEDTPSNQLFVDLGTISNEAMSMGNISKYFGRKADSLSVSIQEGFKYLTTYNYDPMETLHPNQLASFTTGLDFHEHESMKVSQPNGLKGEILPVTSMLREHAKLMVKVVNEVIRPATSRFGHYLSVPFDRAERRDFEFGINIGADLIKLVDAESKFYTGNRASGTTLGSVFNSFSDFVSAERNMQEVNALVHGGSTDEIKKAVQALIQTSNALIRRIGEDRNIGTSNEFAKMIADQLTDVGRWVEWYAAQMTRIIEVNNVLYAIEEQILDLKV